MPSLSGWLWFTKAQVGVGIRTTLNQTTEKRHGFFKREEKQLFQKGQKGHFL